jgi:hypothetical protein
MPAPAKLTFVSNLLTSKIFLAQVVTLIAMIASAAGVHVLDDQGTQAQLIGVLDVVATMLLRWLFPTGPVSLSAPISTPLAQDVPAGASVVTVPAPKDRSQVAGVQPLEIGAHTVEVVPPPPFAPPQAVPATVSITPAS